MGEESITLSMELAKTQCYEFECFEDNYALTISTQGCRINTRKINTKKTVFSTASANTNLQTQNLKIDLRHTLLNIAFQLVGKTLVRQKNSLGTCIPFDIRF